MRDDEIENGGPGSGNFGHAGRPGLVGGSRPYKYGYSKVKREAGQKYRESIKPEKEKAKAELQKYKDLYKQKMKEHLGRLREKHKKEYEEIKAHDSEHWKKQYKTDKEGMKRHLDYLKGQKDKTKYLDYKQEMKDTLKERKQEYDDKLRKRLYQMKVNFKALYDDIKQEDKERYKEMYLKNKDEIMSKFREAIEKKRKEVAPPKEEVKEPIKEEKMKEEEVKKQEEETPTPKKYGDHPTKILKETKKAYLLNYKGKVFWIPKKQINKDGSFTAEGQKIYEEAPLTKDYLKQQAEKKAEFYNRTLDFDNNNIFKETEKAVALKWGFTTSITGDDQTKNFLIWVPKSMITQNEDGTQSIPQSYIDKKISEIKEGLGYGNGWEEDLAPSINKDRVLQKEEPQEQTQEQPKQETQEQPKQEQPTTETNKEQTAEEKDGVYLQGHLFTREKLRNYLETSKNNPNANKSQSAAVNLILNNKDVNVLGFAGKWGWKDQSFLVQKNGKQLWLTPNDVTQDGKLTPQAEKQIEKEGIDIAKISKNPQDNYYKKDYEISQQTKNSLVFLDSMKDNKGHEHKLHVKVPKTEVSVPNTEEYKNQLSINKEAYDKALKKAQYELVSKEPELYQKDKWTGDYQGYDVNELKQYADIKEPKQEQPYQPSDTKIDTQTFTINNTPVEKTDLEKFAKKSYSENTRPSNITISRLLLNNNNIQAMCFLNEGVLISRDGKQLWITRKDLQPNGKLTPQAEKKLQQGQPIQKIDPKDTETFFSNQITEEGDKQIKLLPIGLTDANGKKHKVDIVVPKQYLLPSAHGGMSISVPKSTMQEIEKQAVQKYINLKKNENLFNKDDIMKQLFD